MDNAGLIGGCLVVILAVVMVVVVCCDWLSFFFVPQITVTPINVPIKAVKKVRTIIDRFRRNICEHFVSLTLCVFKELFEEDVDPVLEDFSELIFFITVRLKAVKHNFLNFLMSFYHENFSPSLRG